VAEDRLDSRDWRDLLGWILAGAVGLFLAFKFFFVAFPEAALDLRISRDEAMVRAREFLAAQGHSLEGYRDAIIFSVDTNAKTYLEREMGLEQANHLMASEVNVWQWRARFFRPLKKEEFRVEVDPAGRIVGMRHEVEEAAPGARLERDAARAIAEDFLRNPLRLALDDWDFLPEEANSTERPNRLDWSFTWERRGFKAKDAPYRLRVTLLGDSPGGYEEFLKVPEQWERDFERLRSSNFFYQFMAQVPFFFLLGATLVVILGMARRGLVRWGGTLKLGLLILGLFYLMHLNTWPLARSAYDTKSEYSGFVLEYLVLGLLLMFGQTLLVVLPLAAGEPLYRRDYPEKLRLGAAFTPAGLRSKEFFRASVIGLAMAAAHIGFVVVFYVVGKKYGFWVPQEIKYTDALSTALPWIYPLAISLFAATSEEFLFRMFAIPYVLRLTGSKWMAIVAPAFVWGFLHSAYPVQPGYARGLEVGVIGVVAGWVMLRWGLLATLVWHYTVDAALIGLFLLRSESLYFRLSGGVVAGLALLPLAFAGVAYLARRRFEADESLLNGAGPVPAAEPEAPVVLAMPARVYAALNSRRLVAATLVGIAGAAAALAIEPRAIGSFVRYSTTPREAREKAHEILRQRKLNPESFRHVVTLTSTFNPYANEYLRRQVGIEGANRLYQEKVPSAFWRVRYFRDSEKEEYLVILKPDGALHAVHHLIEEKAPGPNLSKEEAQARAQAYLRDEKGADLAKWKLVESASDKRPARTDHTFVWEELEAIGEARVRAEVKVLGEEVSGYRVFVKIPEEWERRQKETTAGEQAYTVGRILLVVALGILVMVIFVRHVKEYPVPWRRMALWASWAGAAALASGVVRGPLVLYGGYPTEFPLRTWTAIMLVAQALAVAITFSGIFFVLGLAWFYVTRAFWEERIPVWRGMPAAYYRDAVLLGLSGAGLLAGVGRLRVVLERLWPTEKEAFGALLPDVLDVPLPAVVFTGAAVTRGLLLAGALAIVAGLAWKYLRRRWLYGAAILLLAAAMAGSVYSPAEFAKGWLAAVVALSVWLAAVVLLLRFNLMAYFLAMVWTTLAGAAAQLLRQEAPLYHWNAYALVAVMLALLVWPLAEMRRAASAAPPAA
jgi:hypothetical protein